MTPLEPQPRPGTPAPGARVVLFACLPLRDELHDRVAAFAPRLRAGLHDRVVGSNARPRAGLGPGEAGR